MVNVHPLDIIIWVVIDFVRVLLVFLTFVLYEYAYNYCVILTILIKLYTQIVGGFCLGTFCNDFGPCLHLLRLCGHASPVLSRFVFCF